MRQDRMPWSREHTETVIRLFAEGWGADEIAKTLGRSVNSIITKANRLSLHKKFGIQLRHPTRFRTEGEVEEYPNGWKVTAEELDKLMAGRRFEDIPLKRPASMVSYRAPRMGFVPSEASC